MKKLIANLACVLAITSISAKAQEGNLVDLQSSYGMGPFYDAAYYSNTAYVVDGNDDLIVLNVTNSSDIQLVDELNLGCDSTGVDIDGSTLVVQCAFEINFYDLSTSSAPELVGTYESPSYAVNSVKLDGDRLYMIGGNSDVVIYDATDLSNLQSINSQTFGSLGNVSELKKEGSYLYLVSDYNKVRAFDISDENTIVELATLAQALGTVYYDASIYGEALYIGSGDGLHVYDITDINNPSYVTTINSGAFIEPIEGLKSLHIYRDELYAGKSNGWIFQFDISTPLSPVFDEDVRAGTHEVYGFANSSGVLFVAYGVDGLRSLDISAGALPYMKPLGGYQKSIMPADLSLSNSRLLVSDETGLFHIFDIKDDHSFEFKSRMPITQGNSTNAGELKDNIGWLGIEKTLETRDFTTLNPSSFLDSQTPSSSGTITVIKEINSTLYIGTNDGTIALYDVTNDVPSLISSIVLPLAESGSKQYITDITPYGDYVLASSINSELLAVDFSDTANPIVVVVPKLSETTDAKLFVTGDVVLSASDYGVALIDVSDLPSAKYIQQIPSLGLVTAATEIDSETVLLSSTNGLLAVDIADSSNINVISQLSEVPELSSLAIENSSIVGAVRFENELRLYQYNLAPTATSSNYTFDEDTTLNEVLDATDPEGDSVTFELVAQASNGSITLNTDGTFSYEPELNFNGVDSFIFSAEDVHGGKSEAKVTLNITAVNDAPVAVNMAISTNTETEATSSFDATDPDGDELTFSYTNPTNGTLTVQGGDFTYKPLTGFAGEDSFEYTATDPSGSSSTATITITVINNQPIAEDLSLSTDVDTAVSGSFNATDPNGDELSFEYTNPANGSLSVSGTNFTYTPDTGFTGADSFQYTATDPYGASATATVQIRVNSASSGGGSSEWWLLSLLSLSLIIRLRKI